MTASSWDDKLSNEQKAVASHTGSHARLLAGPGTGKTHTMARRILYLVVEKNVDPSSILALTFTRLAARQLKMSVKTQLGGHSTVMPYISTLHGFALRQLHRNSKMLSHLPQPLHIADDWEEENIIRDDMKEILDRTIREVRKSFLALSSDWQTLDADDGERQARNPDAPFIGAWKEHRTVYGYTLRDELIYQLK